MTAAGERHAAAPGATTLPRTAEPAGSAPARRGGGLDRHLRAILACDVVGYARLMAEDENGTFRRLKRFREEIVEPALGRYAGRVVKAMGDGLLVEFADAVAAVECAVEILEALGRTEAASPARQRIELRVGINLGEVIVEGGDIFGTPVNVAARLEQLAEPGGIAVSGAAYWAVRDRTRHGFAEMGFLRLRNIPQPIEVYRLASPTRPAVAAPVQEPSPVWSERRAPHASVVVLPFDNLSSDAAQDFFCEGLTMDLTADLARFSNLVVIDGNSARGFKRQGLPPGDLRRALGVEYMVEGGVQRLGGQVRIAARLVATANNRQLWVERLTRDAGDLFDLQAEVAARIAGALGARLGLVERTRAAQGETDSIDAYEAFLRGLHCMTQFLDGEERPETLRRCREWFDRALALDAGYARAWGWRAYSHVQDWLHGWADDGALVEAERQARKAVALDDSDHDTHWALASVLSNAGRYEEALPEYERALELNPNDADLHAEMAELISFMGGHGDALDRIRFAMRLNPLFPAWYRWHLGWCLYFIGAYEEALAELARLPHPADEALLIRAACHARLAAGGGAGGNDAPSPRHGEEAAENIRLFLARRPGWTLARQRALTRLRGAADMDHWLEGLRLAGLPER